MLPIVWRIILAVAVLGLIACGEPTSAPVEPPTSDTVVGSSAPESKPVVKIIPDNPSVSDCLYVKVKGQSSTGRIIWSVNGQLVESSETGRLCSNTLRRGDVVSVMVDGDAGASASVIIGGSPPQVTGISATPEQVFAGIDIQVFPVAEDLDGDPVEFRYQWVINGQEDPFLTEDLLPGDRFSKGDVIKVRIVPFDGIAEGSAYESYAMTVPNAPPLLLSQPPAQFEAREYRYQVEARDPDGDPLVYRLEQAPAGMTINPATGMVTWPLTGVRPGDYSLKIVVADPEGAEAYQEFKFALGVAAPATP